MHRPGSRLLLGLSLDHSRCFDLVVHLHFSFLLLLVQAFCCLFFCRFRLFVRLPVIVLVILFVFQLPPLLPIASISLQAFTAPSQAPPTFLRFLSASSPFPQLLVTIGRPNPAIHARTLAYRALVALGLAAAVAVPAPVVAGAGLLILIISIKLLHYYRQPFSSFSFSFFWLQAISFHLVFHILVNLLKSKVFPFAIMTPPPNFIVLFSLDNFIQVGSSFVMVVKRPLFLLNRLNYCDHFIND